MISYFKYTNGESFTLNDADYRGLFTVIDGKAYTGTVLNSESHLLTPKNTFLTEIYLQKEELDRTSASNYDLDIININPRDILTQTSVQRLLSAIDVNNKTLVKSSVVANPGFAAFQSLPLNNTGSKFYGLSSTDIDIHLPKDRMVGRRDYTQIDPFKFSNKWGFMDEVISSSFIVQDDKSFTYYVTTSSDSYALSGNINGNDELVIISDMEFTPNSYIKQSTNNNSLYEISSNQINIYELSIYNECKSKTLIDSLNVLDPQLYRLKNNDTQNIRIGDKIRGSLVVSITDSTDIALDIRNAYSNEQYFLIPIKAFNLSNILSFDIRSQDDALIILGEINGFKMLLLVDTSLLTGNTTSGGETDAVLKREQLLYADNVQYIQFSPQDSNVCYLYSFEALESRYISNPRVPCSILDKDDLLFLENYLFDSNPFKFDETFLKFNSNKLESNFPNLLALSISTSDTGSYLSLHFIGRLYIFDLTDSASSNIVLLPSLEKNNTNEVVCSNTYLGASLNKNIFNVVSDTINIYNNYTRQLRSKYVNGVPLLLESFRQETPFKLNLLDFYVHENESVNVLSLQRVTRQIYDLQTKIIDQIYTTDLVTSTQLQTSITLPPVTSTIPVTAASVPDEGEVILATPTDPGVIVEPPSLTPPFFVRERTAFDPALIDRLKNTTVITVPGSNVPSVIRDTYSGQTRQVKTSSIRLQERKPPQCLKMTIEATAIGKDGTNKFLFTNTGSYYDKLGGWLLYNGDDPRILVFGKDKTQLNINGKGAVVLKWNSSSTVPLFGDLLRNNIGVENSQVNGMWELLNTATPSSWKGDYGIFGLLPSPENYRITNTSPTWRPPFSYNANRDIESSPQQTMTFRATRFTSDPNVASNWGQSLSNNATSITREVNKDLYYNKLGSGITLNNSNPQDLGIIDIYSALSVPKQQADLPKTENDVTAILYNNTASGQPEYPYYVDYIMTIESC